MLTRESPEAGFFISPAWFYSEYMAFFSFRDLGSMARDVGLLLIGKEGAVVIFLN